MVSIQLQGIGQVPAIPVKNLKVGNKVMFNYGETLIVDEIFKSSKASYTIVFKNPKTQSKWTQVKRATTLMAKL